LNGAVEVFEARAVLVRIRGVRVGVRAIEVDEFLPDVADCLLGAHRVEPEVRVRFCLMGVAVLITTFVPVFFIVATIVFVSMPFVAFAIGLIVSAVALVFLFTVVLAFAVVAAFVLGSVCFVAAMIVAFFEEVDTAASLDHGDVGFVFAEARHEIVRPRLEPLHCVDKQVRIEHRFLHLWSRLPAVTVLTDRNDRVRGRGVTGDV
jgi:hypothetical protein